MREAQVVGEMIGPFQEMWSRVVAYLPSLGAGLLILVLGIAICWLAKKIFVRAMILLRLDRAFPNIRWMSPLGQADVRHAVANAVGTLAAGIIFLIFLDNALLVWKLEVFARLIGDLVFYLPKFLVGALVLIVGSLLSSAIASRARVVLASEGFSRSSLIARTIHWSLMVLVVAFTLEEMSIAPRTVQITLKIGIGSLGLAVAIALGLGARDLVADLLRGSLAAPTRRE
jgi:hypothetical protein